MFVVMLIVALLSNAVVCEETPTWSPPSLDALLEQWAELSFNDFVDDAVRTYLLYHPFLLTTQGLCEILGVRNDRLGSAGPDYFAQMEGLVTIALEQLERYDRDALLPEDRITYDVLWEQFDGMRETCEAWCSFWISVNPSTACNLYSAIRILYEKHPASTTDDLDDYVVRLWEVDDMIAGMIDEIETAAAVNVTLPYETIWQLIHEWLYPFTEEEGNWFLYVGLDKLDSVDGVTASYESSYLTRLEDAVREAVVPAFDRLVDCLERVAGNLAVGEDVPAWPSSAYWSDYYAALLRGSLGMTVDPVEVHARAKEEAERLRAELCALSNDPIVAEQPTYVVIEILAAIEYACGGYYIDADRLADADSWYALATDRASTLFETLPDSDPVIRLDYVFNAQYQSAAFDGSEAAVFVIPFTNSIERYMLPTTVFHETIPGHHLQIARSRTEDVSLLQQIVTWTGFAEGWAMYAERLAMEQGWHEGNPCGLVGAYKSQLFAATMTVLETGLFALGWTEDEAHAYAEVMCPVSPYEVDSRLTYLQYMPIASTQYFVGLIEFLDQRQRAMDELGDAFDLRGFHEAVLAHGNIPLSALETIVDTYIHDMLEGDSV
jgi:uncharacterized protein (DUF885 family)